MKTKNRIILIMIIIIIRNYIWNYNRQNILKESQIIQSFKENILKQIDI